MYFIIFIHCLAYNNGPQPDPIKYKQFSVQVREQDPTRALNVRMPDRQKYTRSCYEGGRDYLIFRPWRSVKSLAIEPLDIVELHDSVVVLTPPSLSLPFIEHLTAAQ